MKVSHFVPWDAPGRFTAKALCGQYVHPTRDHAVEPTCPRCAQRIVDIEIDQAPTVAAFEQESRCKQG